MPYICKSVLNNNTKGMSKSAFSYIQNLIEGGCCKDELNQVMSILTEGKSKNERAGLAEEFIKDGMIQMLMKRDIITLSGFGRRKWC